ncbi:hypothetical protein K490DRAFT_46308 [Saccharata proteae CBS 121410]|uniref:Lccl domain-containing protein n=1 Tax=Saccharata proteae CBS 121410 TaxID=1314787 RepID=A0A9P4HSJ6_9PEZI|nr:hypothetical protein K490DRAFT_46308 [Saccharata proteae CBS 121410]
MAAPPEKTLHDLNGAWIMNKTLSGDSDAVMQLQGVGWLIRKTISFATVTLHTKQYMDDAGVEHVDIAQAISGGKGTQELRALNNEWEPHSDIVFGKVRGRCQWIKTADLEGADEDKKWMREGWDKETLDKGEFIECLVESVDKGWTAWQVWGFEDVNGERRYARHVVVKDKSGKKVQRIKLIYDWAGQSASS